MCRVKLGHINQYYAHLMGFLLVVILELSGSVQLCYRRLCRVDE